MPMTVTCPGCKASLNVREDYAGKGMQCPRCSASFTVPEVTELEEVTEVMEKIPSKSRPEGTKPCPECGEHIALAARKCRHCKAWVDDEDEDDEDEDYGPRYKPCPRCQARGAKRVTWTFWGSFYGPALFSHVRCPQCGYAYNGKTGRSNVVPAVIFVTIPAVLIAGIVAAVFFVVMGRLNP